MSDLDQKISERTGGTERTFSKDEPLNGSLPGTIEGTTTPNDIQNSSEFKLEAILPNHVQPEILIEPEIERPGFMVYDDWFSIESHCKSPGLYWHGFIGGQEPKPIDIWVCSPIHAEAITADERNESFGLLLRFIQPFGGWREWSMPMHLLKGNGDEMRGELLNLGVRINLDAKKYLNSWLMQQKPERRTIAATRTGWHSNGQAFVMPNKTIGDDKVRFQSEYAAQDDFIQQGDIHNWRKQVAQRCSGNPILLLSVSAAFAAPLLLKAKQQSAGGGGIHLIGKSSNGKTTALQVAASVWGGPGYVRAWRATANGLEATAAALNDSLLVLDEISECDPREIGAIIYALANGQGKQRAKRNGSSRDSFRWRTIVLSSGERTLSAHMQEAGQQVKAGQEARLLNIPATDRLYGAFDNLHGLTDGRAFADSMKQAINQFYGVAGPEFVKKLLEDKGNLSELYVTFCKLSGFYSSDGIENRAAGLFALIALAGEKATEYGLTGWHEGEALEAAIELFNAWREFRGQGQTETRQILQGIRYFIDRHGDSRFSGLEQETKTMYQGDNIDQRPVVRDRAGYWKDTDRGRIFLFNSSALQEAATGFDLKVILQTLNEAEWIIEKDHKKNSKKIKIEGRTIPLYWILVKEEI
jgi:putative DNA primase/helicase